MTNRRGRASTYVMTLINRLWTHLNPAQAAGRACVMCAEPTTDPLWIGVPVGCSENGADVFTCEGRCTAWAAAVANFDP